jgi:hypothetical protein
MSRQLGEVFAQRDPPAVAVGLTALEFETFVRLFCPKAEAEGLTVVARSAMTGEMIGALLVEDSASVPPDGVDQLSGKFNPIFDILGQLDTEYRAGRAIQPGESLHLLLLGRSTFFVSTDSLNACTGPTAIIDLKGRVSSTRSQTRAALYLWTEA